VITLIGVGHVFNIGDAVRSVIFQERPAAVCLELDDERLAGLQAKANGHPVSGQGRVYRSLGDFQAKVANSYGTTVGAEMLAANEAASLLGVPVHCIDMKASEFFDRAFKSMSLREKIYLVLNSIAARFAGRKRIEGELEQYQENDAVYIEQFGKKFPSLKRVLIDERNEFMASRIRKLADGGGNVVAVIGDGHVEGISKLLSGYPVKLIRLKELRAMQESLANSGLPGNRGNSGVSFSFTYR
jgi:pheromone shutdown protein TraB